MESKKVRDKTRDLAHSRRKKENDTFIDIAQALPLHENAKDLDKASILRVAIHYLKLRSMIRDGNDEEQLTEEQLQALDFGKMLSDCVIPDHVPPVAVSQELGDVPAQEENIMPTISDILPNFSKDVLQALDGFMMVVARDGTVLYVSESITNYLGLRQVDVIGVHVQELIHPQDCGEVATIFQTQGHDVDQIFDAKDPLRRKFVVRMRCAFTPSVRSITRCSNFKPIYCSCFLKFGRSGQGAGQFLGIVALCKLVSVPRIKELVVGTFFKTKHALDLSYTSVDTRIRWILGYDPSEMVGLKAYQYFHPQDLTATSSCHMNLLSRGQSNSPCYRFMTNWGDWMWVRSKSQMLFNKRSHLPEGIVIYTWIVRFDEEDDRMKAIQNGEDGEDKMKKYDAFQSEVSSSAGKLDISTLANPNATTTTDVTLNEKPAPTNHVVTKLEPISSISQSVNDSSSPVYNSQHVSSPPANILSPDSTNSDCLPNANLLGALPNGGHGDGTNRRSPPEQLNVMCAAEIIDQTSFSQQQTHQSFMPSPPYTPYDCSPTKHGSGLQFSPSFDVNGSNYVSTVVCNGGLPCNKKIDRRSLSPSESSSDGGQHGNISPPYTTSTMSYNPTISANGVQQQFINTNPSSDYAQIMDIRGSYQSTGFNNCADVISNGDRTASELHFVNDVPMHMSSVPVPPHRVNNLAVNNARARYSGVIPSSHIHSNCSSSGQVSGAIGNDNDQDSTDPISQWSQWLKSGAPTSAVY